MNDESFDAMLAITFTLVAAIEWAAAWVLVERRYRGTAVVCLAMLAWCAFCAGRHFARATGGL